MKLLRNAICMSAILGAASFVLAADTPFAGTWKLNLGKSRLTGDTVSFTQEGDRMRITGGGESYLFKTDGSASTTRFGTTSWKQVDNRTWKESDMVKDRLDSTNTWTLSGDEKTLTEHITGDKPGGGSFDDTITYVRQTGSHGLAGSWKDREFKGSSPSLLVISDAGNGLVFDEPDFRLKATAGFDGKPGKVEGPSIPDGASFVLNRIGSHSFKMTRTQNAKPFDTCTWTVSPDGKILKVTTRTLATNDPPTTEIFEKQ